MYRYILALVSALMLMGCAVSPTPAYRSHGYYGGGYSTYHQSSNTVQTMPCKPFNANDLMAWAKELPDNKTHTRSANVTVQNSEVNCSTTESAGSRQGK